jgi:hypothetical protein
MSVGRKMDAAWKKAISEGLKRRNRAGSRLENTGKKVENMRFAGKVGRSLIAASTGAGFGATLANAKKIDYYARGTGATLAYVATRSPTAAKIGGNVGSFLGGAIPVVAASSVGQKLFARKSKITQRIGKRMQKIGKRMQGKK